MYVPPKPVEFLFQEQQFCVFKMQTPPKMKVLLAKKGRTDIHDSFDIMRLIFVACQHTYVAY